MYKKIIEPSDYYEPLDTDQKICFESFSQKKMSPPKTWNRLEKNVPTIGLKMQICTNGIFLIRRFFEIQ